MYQSQSLLHHQHAGFHLSRQHFHPELQRQTLSKAVPHTRHATLLVHSLLSRHFMPRRRPPPSYALSSLSPLRISIQILALQLGYYICTTALILFTALTAGRPFSMDLVLSWRSLRGDTAVGWTLGLCWLVGGGLSGCVFFPSLPRLLLT